ncbi:Uncharacterised protein [Mycobacteroides abscessus]|nr:Uncharacterised protein [Mycobacteroides abscessus]
MTVSPCAATTGSASAHPASRADARTSARAVPSPTRGTESSNARVYAACGAAKSSRAGACSTTFP